MELSVWLCLAFNGVEDIEDWRSALSDSEITEVDRACVETEAIRSTCLEL